MTQRCAGFTLVELLVALALGVLCVALAWSHLDLAQRQWQLLDHDSQLQDRQRLAADVLGRMLRHVQPATAEQQALALYGWDNAFFGTPDNPQPQDIQTIAHGNRPRRCGSARDTSCRNGSDVLALRATSTLPHCGGSGSVAPNSLFVLHVNRSDKGSPGLACSYQAASGGWTTIPLVEDVESLQLVYGLRAANATHIAQWLPAHAMGMGMGGDALATAARWRRVVAVRAGMVLRTAPAAGNAAASTVLFPLGPAYARQFPDDSGATLRVPADRRTRQVATYTFTLHGQGSTAP